MAAITTVPAATARWEDPAAWSSGTVPTSADDVTVGNQRFSITAMSGGVGADAVFTATGHTFVANDEVVLGSTGYAYSPFLTGKPYFVVSPATNTFKLALTPGGAPITTTAVGLSTPLNVAKKYVLTLDSDPSLSRHIRTLLLETGVVFKVSTAGNTQLQAGTSWTVSAGAVLDCDLSAHPSITSKWLLGSAGAASLNINSGSNYHKLRGKPRKRRANLLSSLTANTTTSFVVSDATGWEVGDQLVLSPTQPRNNVTTIKVSVVNIVTITPGAGTTATITFTGTGTGGNTTPNLHLTGGHVGNFASNFTLESVNKATQGVRGNLFLDRGNGSGSNSRQYGNGVTDNLGQIFIENVRFDSMGNAFNRFSLTASFATDVQDFTIGGLNSNACYDSSGALSFPSGGSPCAIPTADNIAVQLTLNSTNPFSFGNLATDNIPSGFASFWALGNNAIDFAGGCSLEIDDFVVAGGNWIFAPNAGAAKVVAKNSEFYCTENLVFGNCAKFELQNCDVSKFMTGVSNQPQINRFSGNGETKLVNSLVSAAYRPTSITSAPNATRLVYENLNNDAEQQFVYSNRSFETRPAWERDNATVKNSLSSIKGYYSGVLPLELSQQVLTASGVPAKVVGYMRKNAAYGSVNLPYVEMSGLGTTVRATMSNIDDTWEQFTIDFTQNSGGDGAVTLRLVNSCAGTSGNCWFSGLTLVPFVTRARHYGYTFDESNPLRVVNPVVSAPEATAAAYTGVTIDTAAPQISVGTGSANTFQKVYDHIQAWAVQNIDKPVLLTSTDGNNFAIPLTCKVVWPGMGTDGTLAGGWLQLAAPGTHTYKLSGTKIEFQAAGSYNMSGTQFGGTVELVNTSGGAVTVSVPSGTAYTNTGPGITVTAPTTNQSVTVNGLEPGSRIQIYDLDSDTELFNGVVAGSSHTWSDPSTPVAPRTIRLRAAWASGAVAKQFVDTGIGTCGTGMGDAAVTYLINQQADTIYGANALDGSTVTGITIVDAVDRMQINIAGGTVSWKAIYAYNVFWLTTEDGIRDDGSIITAKDVANYTLALFRIKNTSATPLQITGGYGVDSVTGSVADILDTTGGSIFPVVDHVVSSVVTVSGGNVVTGTAADIIAAMPSAVANASAVRTELGTELARLDVAVSARNAATPPPAAASVTAMEDSTVLAKEVTVASRLAASSYQAAPSAASVAGAVLAAAAAAPIAANVEAINGTAITGGGVPGNEWGPA